MAQIPKVSFYITQAQNATANFGAVVRIVTKAYQQKNCVYLLVRDASSANQISELLWTQRDTSFLAHEILKNPISSNANIAISANTETPTLDQYDVLINLTQTKLPDWQRQFKRIIEIVSQDANDKQSSRERYKQYQQNDFDIDTHQL